MQVYYYYYSFISIFCIEDFHKNLFKQREYAYTYVCMCACMYVYALI